MCNLFWCDDLFFISFSLHFESSKYSLNMKQCRIQTINISINRFHVNKRGKLSLFFSLAAFSSFAISPLLVCVCVCLLHRVEIKCSDLCFYGQIAIIFWFNEENEEMFFCSHHRNWWRRLSSMIFFSFYSSISSFQVWLIRLFICIYIIWLISMFLYLQKIMRIVSIPNATRRPINWRLWSGSGDISFDTVFGNFRCENG